MLYYLITYIRTAVYLRKILPGHVRLNNFQLMFLLRLCLLDVLHTLQLLLWVINAHYHHPEEDTAIRVRQTEVILDFWDGKDRTVFLGDLNTRLGEEPLAMLSQAGLYDAMDLAGVEPGFTTPPEEPQHRIDYIWVSGDLDVRDAVIPRSLASDHLPVVATIAPEP